MLPKVRASLLKNLKPLSTESQVADSPQRPRSAPGLSAGASDFTSDHRQQTKLAQVISFPQSDEHTSIADAPAPRNPVIEFFGKLRAGFPVLRAMVVAAYSRAAKSLKSGNRQKKGILVDRDQL